MELSVTRKQVFIAVFVIVFLYILYLSIGLFLPFFNALFWAGFLAYAAFPLYQKLLILLRGRCDLASLIMTVITITVVVGPTIVLIFILSSQMLDFYTELTHYVNREGGIMGLWGNLEMYLPTEFMNHPLLEYFKIQDVLINAFQQVSSNLGARVGSMLRNTVSITVNVFIMIMALFFFFRNGQEYIQTFFETIPLPDEQKTPVKVKFDETMFAVIYGIFFIAVQQGVMVGIGLALFGFTFSVFWGFVAFVLALIPIVGAALVWIPAVLYLLLETRILEAFLLTLWGMIFTTAPDMLFKPMLIGHRARIPVFFLILGIIGGLRVYGIQGIVIGPLIVALMGVFIQIYKENYLSRREKDNPDDVDVL